MLDQCPPTAGSSNSPAIRQRAARTAAATFALYEQGLTQAEIGKRLGIGQTSVSSRLRRAGYLTGTRKLPGRFTADDFAAMQLMCDRGMTLHAIAQRFGTRGNVIGRHVTRGRAKETGQSLRDAATKGLGNGQRATQ